MKENVKDMEVQGTENVTGKKKQKVSISYTLKSFSENIKKLVENKIITAEDGEALKVIHKKAVNHWIGIEMGI